MSKETIIKTMIPKSFFPSMPNQVREMWINSISEGYGWPFKSLQDSCQDTPWHYVFAGKSLKYIHDLQWELSSVDFSKNILCPTSLDTVTRLLRHHTVELDAAYADVTSTHDRFKACADYTREFHTIPCPIIVIEHSGMIQLLDGCHRLAALHSIKPLIEYTVPAWIARSPKV